MPRVLLGITGSVAALKTPELFAALRQGGHEVKVVATQPALYFFEAAMLPPGTLYTDEQEWPGRETGKRWQRSDPIQHIELRRWAEALVVAPLDANTLAKLAGGICDNCLTCVWRAWDLTRPVLLAPAMNTLMWEHPLTVSHLHRLAHLYRLQPPTGLNADQLVAWINARDLPNFRIAGPVEKALACGDVGQGAMSEVHDLVNNLAAYLSGKS